MCGRGEAALLANRIGAMFADAALTRGDPLQYEGLECEIFLDENGVGKGMRRPAARAAVLVHPVHGEPPADE